MLVLAGLLILIGVSSASAGGWLYRRGGPPVPQVNCPPRSMPSPLYRSAHRPAVVDSRFGYAARGGFRINRIFLRSGNSTDLTIIREDWFDVRP